MSSAQGLGLHGRSHATCPCPSALSCDSQGLVTRYSFLLSMTEPCSLDTEQQRDVARRVGTRTSLLPQTRISGDERYQLHHDMGTRWLTLPKHRTSFRTEHRHHVSASATSNLKVHLSGSRTNVMPFLLSGSKIRSEVYSFCITTLGARPPGRGTAKVEHTLRVAFAVASSLLQSGKLAVLCWLCDLSHGRQKRVSKNGGPRGKGDMIGCVHSRARVAHGDMEEYVVRERLTVDF
jgi:hypothetical protein